MSRTEIEQARWIWLAFCLFSVLCAGAILAISYFLFRELDVWTISGAVVTSIAIDRVDGEINHHIGDHMLSAGITGITSLTPGPVASTSFGSFIDNLIDVGADQPKEERSFENTVVKADRGGSRIDRI